MKLRVAPKNFRVGVRNYLALEWLRTRIVFVLIV